MKGPPWWCWWRAGANLVALQCDTHKSSSPKKRKPRWSSKSHQNEICKVYLQIVFLVFLFELWGRCFSIAPWQLVDLRTALQADISSFVCWRWMKFAATLKLWNNNDISIFINFCLSSSTCDDWRLFVANPTDSIGQSRTALAGRKDCRIIPVRDSQYIMHWDWSPCVTTTESRSCITLKHANCNWSHKDGKQMELADNAQLSSSLPAHYHRYCHRLKSETDDNHRAKEPSSWNILLSASFQGTCSVSLSMIFWVRLQVATRWDTICLHLSHFISF